VNSEGRLSPFRLLLRRTIRCWAEIKGEFAFIPEHGFLIGVLKNSFVTGALSSIPLFVGCWTKPNVKFVAPGKTAFRAQCGQDSHLGLRIPHGPRPVVMAASAVVNNSRAIHTGKIGRCSRFATFKSRLRETEVTSYNGVAQRVSRILPHVLLKASGDAGMDSV
jgi:hypothetical protein